MIPYTSAVQLRERHQPPKCDHEKQADGRDGDNDERNGVVRAEDIKQEEHNAESKREAEYQGDALNALASEALIPFNHLEVIASNGSPIALAIRPVRNSHLVAPTHEG